MLIRLGEHGVVTLPEEIRVGLDDAVLLDVVQRDDGVIELWPQGKIDPTQQWYWSEEWQRMEQVARAEYAEGHFKRYGNVEEFLAGLDAPTE
jgi:antitoxin MazE